MADSLLDELKNLNKVLKEETKKDDKSHNSSNMAISSGFVGSNSTTMTISGSLVPTTSAIPPFVLTYDNLGDFILQQSQQLVLESIEAVKELKITVLNTIDPDAMSGLANVIKATTGALDTLNNLNLEAHKAKNAKELKTLDIEGRKQISSSKKPNQTVNIMANREDMMKMMEEVERKSKELPAIDAEFQEINKNV